MDGVVAVDMGYVLKKDGTIWTTEYYTRTASSVDCVWGAYHKVLDGVLLPGEIPTIPDKPTPPAGDLTVEKCALAQPTFSYGKAVLKNGDLYSWGTASRNLGVGDKTNASGELYQSVPMKLDSGYISVGTEYWGIKSDNSLWTWWDIVPNGFEEVTNPPVKKADNVAFAVRGYTIDMSSGGMILRSDGSLYTWGSNWFPGVDARNFSAAEAVKCMDGVKQISSIETMNDFCFLKKDGALWGIDMKQGERFLVKTMDNVAAFEMHYGAFYAIKTDGSLYKWTGSTAKVPSAAEVTKVMDGVVDVTCFRGNCYFLTSGGTLYKTKSAPDAEIVKVMDGVVAIEDNCALKADGSLWTTWDPATDNVTENTFRKILDNVLLPGESIQTSKPSRPSSSSSSSSGTTGTVMTNNGGGAGARPGTATKPNPPAGETKPTQPANPFTDISEGAYYYDAVLWALENGITTGVTETEFRPSATCTRGQVVTFLWRAKGSPEPKTQTNPFTDVSPSSPFYKAILWAYENNITAGQTAGTFNPGGNCTSGHVVTFLWRANGKPSASGSSTLAAANPGKYYTDAIAWADAAGLLSGMGGDFVPGSSSPRADIVTYLYRDMEK